MIFKNFFYLFNFELNIAKAERVKIHQFLVYLTMVAQLYRLCSIIATVHLHKLLTETVVSMLQFLLKYKVINKHIISNPSQELNLDHPAHSQSLH
jgi:hypothetical protein